MRGAGTDRHKGHEADLVVLMPDSGVVVVEVKGSHVWTEDGARAGAAGPGCGGATT